jgi:hypothetical protein
MQPPRACACLRDCETACTPRCIPSLQSTATLSRGQATVRSAAPASLHRAGTDPGGGGGAPGPHTLRRTVPAQGAGPHPVPRVPAAAARGGGPGRGTPGPQRPPPAQLHRVRATGRLRPGRYRASGGAAAHRAAAPAGVRHRAAVCVHVCVCFPLALSLSLLPPPSSFPPPLPLHLFPRPAVSAPPLGYTFRTGSQVCLPSVFAHVLVCGNARLTADEDSSFAVAYALALRHAVVEASAHDTGGPLTRQEAYVDAETFSSVLLSQVGAGVAGPEEGGASAASVLVVPVVVLSLDGTPPVGVNGHHAAAVANGMVVAVQNPQTSWPTALLVNGHGAWGRRMRGGARARPLRRSPQAPSRVHPCVAVCVCMCSVCLCACVGWRAQRWRLTCGTPRATSYAASCSYCTAWCRRQARWPPTATPGTAAWTTAIGPRIRARPLRPQRCPLARVWVCWPLCHPPRTLPPGTARLPCGALRRLLRGAAARVFVCMSLLACACVRLSCAKCPTVGAGGGGRL